MDKILIYFKNNDVETCKKHIYDENINIHYDEEELFRYCCKNGYLESAVMLWEISKKTIDIHIKYEYAFTWGCVNGHLKIIKWLWEISNKTINMRVYNDYAFVWSCKKNHKSVAEFLCKLCDEYHINIDDNVDIVNNYSIDNYFLDISKNNDNKKKLKKIFKFNKKKGVNFDDICAICNGCEDYMVNTKCQYNDKSYNHYYCVECFGDWFTNKSKSCLYCNRMIIFSNCIFYF